jgi:hypothetical protein
MDNTLCEERPSGERCLARPFPRTVDLVRRAAAEGHRVVIYTARPWTDWRVTVKWLEDHGVPFAAVVCGKLNFDFFLDDRADPSPDKLEEYLDAHKPARPQANRRRRDVPRQPGLARAAH